MKKTMLLLAVAGVMAAGMASCKKDEMPASAITQTIDVGLKVGESYTFALPGNTGNYEILSPATHASLSAIGVNNSGEHIYEYTPEAGYSGSDQVIVSNDKDKKPDCAHPQGPPPAGAQHGDCTGEKDEHYTITINFTMQDTISESK
jgi:hypothetical protein